jgi:subtilisin family serine protease
VEPALDLRRAAAELPPVRVAVLDVHPELNAARASGEHFQSKANNAQLLDTVDWVQQHTSSDARYEEELAALAPLHSFSAHASGAATLPSYPIPDHGLFVAGLIRGIAPTAPISLEPVLDEEGVGDLSQLLLGLKRVLRDKDPNEPQIINLSLGFLPHPARLPAAWYGLRRAQDPEYARFDDLFDADRDERWVAANRDEVDRAVDLLQAGLRQLATYLSLNNCLVVAAAGNDSLAQVDAGRARLEPRLPARFYSVLGVAATTSNPRQPARYSNRGDVRELGDHIATFGGNSSEALEPEDGVIGIYSGKFPDGRPNETGWAFWSGTSFATAIVSGIVANFWAVQRVNNPNLHAAGVLAELHAEVSERGPYVSALRTPAIEVQGRWR